MPMVASPQDPDDERGLQRFANDEFDIQMIPAGDSFKVIATGLAKALGHRDGLDLVRNIPDSEKGYGVVRTPGGEQQVWTLTEPGFYRAIGQRQAARVKDPEMRDRVERFQSWVYGDVLPSIRKTGSYSMTTLGDPLTELEVQTQRTTKAIQIAKAERARAELAESKVRELEPAAQAWDVLASASGDFSLRDTAFILNRDPGIDTGQQRLMKLIRALNMVDRNDVPYARHASHLTERPQTYTHPRTGEEMLAKPQIRITMQGLKYLHGKLGGVAPLHVEQLPFRDAG